MSTLIVRMPFSFPPTSVISEPSGALGHASSAQIVVAGDFFTAVGHQAVAIGLVEHRTEHAAQDRVGSGVAIAGGEHQELIWTLVDRVVVVEAVLNRTARRRRAVVSVATAGGTWCPR